MIFRCTAVQPPHFTENTIYDMPLHSPIATFFHNMKFGTEDGGFSCDKKNAETIIRLRRIKAMKRRIVFTSRRDPGWQANGSLPYYCLKSFK